MNPFLYQVSRIMVRIRCPGEGGAGKPRGGRMSEQALDLRRSAADRAAAQDHRQHCRRAWPRRGRRRSPCSRPPMLTSNALVVLPAIGARSSATQVVIASSDPVLAGALRGIDPAMSLQTLRSRVQVKSLTSDHHLDQRPGQDRRPGRGHRERRRQQLRRLRRLRRSTRRASAGAGPGARDERHRNVAAPFACSLPEGSAPWLGAADRSHRRACDRPQRPAPAGARRDSGRHRGSRPGVDPRRSPIRRRGLDEAL